MADDQPGPSNKPRTVAETVARLSQRMKAGAVIPRGKSSNTRIKVAAILVGVIVVLGSIIALALVFQVSDSFNTLQVQFQSEIEIQGDNDGILQWDEDLNNPSSEKRRQFSEDFQSKLTGALESEGISVEKIEINNIQRVDPGTIIRNVEETRKTSGQPAPVGRNSFKQVAVDDENFVNVKYTTYGRPLSNAATFASAADYLWNSVSKSIQTRLASVGVTSKVEPIKPEESFSVAVRSAVENHAYEIVTPAIEAQDSTVCGCHTVALGKVSLEIPSLICDCFSGCLDGEVYEIHGGVNNVFSLRTPLCVAAYYADIIPEDGGFVEVVYSGQQTVASGPDRKIPGIEMVTTEAYIDSITLKELGTVIKPTLPPTTANPAIGGFFRIETTTLNPFVVHDAGRKLLKQYANPPITMSLHVVSIGGQPIQYSELFGDKDLSPEETLQSDNIQDILNSIRRSIVDAFKGLSLDDLEVQMTNVDVPSDEAQGIISQFILSGKVEAAVKAITEVEKTDELLYTLVERALSSVGTLVSFRYSVDLILALRKEDDSARK